MLKTKKNGRDVVGCKIVCHYQGSNDPAAVVIDGMVKSQRKIEGKGNLLLVETAKGYRSIYFEKATNVMFYAPRSCEPKDDNSYDQWKDNCLTERGYIPRKSR
jgi:hypothetical protein